MGPMVWVKLVKLTIELVKDAPYNVSLRFQTVPQTDQWPQLGP